MSGVTLSPFAPIVLRTSRLNADCCLFAKDAPPLKGIFPIAEDMVFAGILSPICVLDIGMLYSIAFCAIGLILLLISGKTDDPTFASPSCANCFPKLPSPAIAGVAPPTKLPTTGAIALSGNCCLAISPPAPAPTIEAAPALVAGAAIIFNAFAVCPATCGAFAANPAAPPLANN